VLRARAQPSPHEGRIITTAKRAERTAVAYPPVDPAYPRVPFDVQGYTARVTEDARDNRCFICAIVDGTRTDHHLVYRDELCIAFLNRFPTLFGYTLVAPLAHRTGVVSDFSEVDYLGLQLRVHRVGRAVAAAVPTERLYILSLGSVQGNAHVHWHVAPLPPGVAYEQQQFAALMAEHGCLDIPDDDQAALAEQIARFLSETSP
jgi:diadenosine tetraphosphate (Ap4A) HIT family hydrolase